MPEPRVQRQLAAILAADVVGYSRLMEIDEAGTLARLKSLRREIIDPAIAAHSGRMVKLMGDGALVEFASAVDAVTCAIEIQKSVRKHNADGPAKKWIQFRIGINVGDIIVDGEDIYGDGVNVAARIESLAEPGWHLHLASCRRPCARQGTYPHRESRRSYRQEHRAADRGILRCRRGAWGRIGCSHGGR